MINKKFWQGKKVLLTGHTGFKGSWLAIWLLEMGAEVCGYSLDPYTNKDNFVLANLDKKISKDIRADLRDFDTMLKVFEEFKPEIVFHLAAQPLVRLSYQIPKDTYDVNFGGTVNVLEVIRKTKSVKAAVLITTDKCYENKEWLWGYRENEAMGGFDPYSSSKGAAELAISAYRRSFFDKEQNVAISSARAGNVIGGGDWAKDRIIPDSILALEKDLAIEVRNPEAKRPWQHVLEPISAYLILAEKMSLYPNKYNSAWNFGPDTEAIIPVKDVVNLLLNFWGSGSWLDVSCKDELHEAKLLALDCSKAKFVLGWQPRLTIKEAIKLTVDWYQNYTKKDVYELCSEQIKYYENLDKFDNDYLAKLKL